MPAPIQDQQYCRFYIMRHAQSEGNRLKIIQGQADFELTNEGEQAAEKLSKKFQTIHFDDVFASDLLRARRTAELISQEQKIAVKTSQLLREQTAGKYDGRPWQEYREELKDLIEEYENLADEQKFTHKISDEIETDDQAIGRFLTFLREVAVAYAGKTVLVVSHGSMIRKLLIHLGYATYAELDHGSVKNLAYFVLDSDGVEFFVQETDGIIKTEIKSKRS